MNVALRPESINIISLCTGGGGLDLGVELALPAARSVAMVEREAFAVAHLVAAIEQGLMAPAAIWSNVRTFDGRPWRGIVDGIIGGIPCQPHSEAGKRLGAADARDLWRPTRRIIVQARPWFVLIENVRGMVFSGGLERIWRDLQRLGFAVECGLFTAAEVGDSQERTRLFVLAVADPGCSQRGPSFEPRHLQHWPSSRRLEGTGGAREPNADLAHAKCDGWGERISGAGLCSRQSQPDGSGRPLADRQGPEGQLYKGSGRSLGTALDDGRSGLGLFPPGPTDLERWGAVLDRAPQLEPAVRRVADGVASEVGSRVDELRMLGNGVVPLEAAYAFRTLAARLAGRGSAGAALLARMMEG